MTEHRILTTVVGSYPVPAWLAAYPTTPNLRDAVLVVTKTQELAGLDVISDGELSRFDVNHPETNGMIEHFIRPMAGIRANLGRSEVEQFRKQSGMGFRTQPAGVIEGPVGEGSLNLPAAWRFVKSLATRPMKFTLTSPYMLGKTLVDSHYGDRRSAVMALAEVLAEQVASIDAPVVQVDEANLPGSPEDGVWAAEAVNVILRRVKTERAVHLCFGNYGGQTIQRGLYESLLPFMNALECNHLVLEFARRGYGELDVFRGLREEIALGIGVIDIKDNEVETPDEVARRIEKAAAVLGEARIRWIHPDCGFWMLPRSVADRKMAALVAGRNLYEGLPA